MSGCVKCGSMQAYWTIKEKDGKTNDYCDDCYKKFELADYKKEMDEYHKLKKEADEQKKREKLSQQKSSIDRKANEIFRGGFGELYCSENCYGEAGREITNRIMSGARGICAFCQSPVLKSLNNPEPSVMFPFRNQLFFICAGCIKRGKEYVKNIKECCMCGK